MFSKNLCLLLASLLLMNLVRSIIAFENVFLINEMLFVLKGYPLEYKINITSGTIPI